MPTDYELLEAENRRRYGEETEHLAFLGELYAERSHFILELLQNAEDAGARSVEFRILQDQLEVRHDGRVFSADDVQGICSVGQSTKKSIANKIGRFGIGFKSVYAYTGQPQIHSGNEHFVIRHYVRPAGVGPADPGKDWTTLICLPFDSNLVPAATARTEILAAAKKLAPATLLFLRYVGTVTFFDDTSLVAKLTRVDGSPIDEPARVVGVGAMNELAQSWVVFSRPVQLAVAGGATRPASVEVAFRLASASTADPLRIVSQSGATIAAYFPTDIRTGTGFILQAPFHTTPARDNLKRDDAHNVFLVQEAGLLVVDVLRWLRQRCALDVEVLKAMPIRTDDFPEGAFLRPIYDMVAEGILENDLLLCRTADGEPTEYVAGQYAAWAQAEKLAALLTPDMLPELVAEAADVRWLCPSLGAETHSDLGMYLSDVLEIPGIGIDDFLAWLSAKGSAWWSGRERAWLVQLYEYFDGLPDKRVDIQKLLCVRLANGEHAAPSAGVLFFPASDPLEAKELAPFMDGLPIIDGETASESQEFLARLGVIPLTALGFVDRVVRAKYKAGGSISAPECVGYLRYVKLALPRLGQEAAKCVVEIIKGLQIVVCREASRPDSLWRVLPTDAYLGSTYTKSEDLAKYFAATPSTYFVDDGFLAGTEDPAEWAAFFGRLGVADRPRHIPVGPGKYDFQAPNDSNIDGLEEAITALASCVDNDRATRAKVVWRMVLAVAAAVPDDRSAWERFTRTSRRVFGPRGGDHGQISGDASWVELLRRSRWLPDKGGALHRPADLLEPTPKNRKLLGTEQIYLDAAVELKATGAIKLAETLGIRRSPTKDAVIERLLHLSNSSERLVVQDVTPLYEFFEPIPAHVKSDFAKSKLIFSPDSTPQWCHAGHVFWEDHSKLFGTDRGYLGRHYPKLEKFFVSVGVALEPSPAACIAYLRQTARSAKCDPLQLTRIGAVCKRVANRLGEDDDWQDDLAWQTEWSLAKAGPTWPGRLGDNIVFVSSKQLAVRDNEHRAALFAGRVALWPFAELDDFAVEYLDAGRLSEATRTCATRGGGLPDETISRVLVDIWDLVIGFLRSPAWSPHVQPESVDLAAVRPTVYRVEAITAHYKILGVEVADPEPADAFFDTAHGRLWLRMDLAGEGEVAEAIGNELAQVFGPDALSEFVRDALEKDRAALIKKWSKRGLMTAGTSPTDVSGDDEVPDRSTDQHSDPSTPSGLHPEIDATAEEDNDDLEGGEVCSKRLKPMGETQDPESSEDDDDQDRDADDAEEEEQDDDDHDEDEDDEEHPADDDETEEDDGVGRRSGRRSRASGKANRPRPEHSNGPAAGTRHSAADSTSPSSHSKARAGDEAPSAIQGEKANPAFGGRDSKLTNAGSPSEFMRSAFNRPGHTEIRRESTGGGPVRDAETRRERIRDEIGRSKEIEPRRAERVHAKTVDIWESKNKEVRDFLLQEYGGDCQICHSVNVFPRRSDGRPYFEGVYLVPHAIAAWTDRPGNVLCLCGLCSAKWQHGSLETPRIESQVKSLWTTTGGRTTDRLQVRLIEKHVDVRFSERHAIELQELWAAANDLNASALIEAERAATAPCMLPAIKPASTELVQCPQCPSLVRLDNLPSHQSRVHANGAAVGSAAPRSTSQPAARQKFPSGRRTQLCLFCRTPFQATAGQIYCLKCRPGQFG